MVAAKRLRCNMAKIVKITHPVHVPKVPPSQVALNAKREMDMGPSMYEQARGLAKAIYAHASSGFKTVRKETHEARLAICAQCTSWEPSGWGGMGRCKQCGCSGIKLTWKTSICPLAKWGMEHE
jgi:hypothetical protein